MWLLRSLVAQFTIIHYYHHCVLFGRMLSTYAVVLHAPVYLLNYFTNATNIMEKG